MKRAGLYIRVSSDEQARHGYSLSEQRHVLEEYAARHGFSVVDVYADEGATARRSVHNRHELQRLLSDVRAGLIDIILFIKLDRWFRNVKDFYKVQDVLDRFGVDWIATQEDYNTTTSNGRLMLNLKLSIAQNESDQTSDRIKFVFEGKRRRKEVIAGVLPVGFKIENHKYVIDEPRADIVRAAFEFYSVHQSIGMTYKHLNEQYPEMHFHAQNIRRMLVNERYIGRFFGIEDYSPAIIDRDLWERVQKVIAIGKRGETPRKAIEPYLFSGLLFCPRCGHRLNGIRASRKKIKYYRCNNNHIQHHCDFPGLPAESLIERYLLDNIESRIKEHASRLEVVQDNRERESKEKQIKAVNNRLDRLKDLYVSGFIDRATYEKDFKANNEELTALLLEEKQRPQKIAPQLESILQGGMESLYNQLSMEGKKTFWKSIIHRLEITFVSHREKPQRIELEIIFL